MRSHGTITETWAETENLSWIPTGIDQYFKIVLTRLGMKCKNNTAELDLH
jgi:hypothetical protein